MATENVTILFTDLVGSTALSSELSPGAADEIRRGHFAILRKAVSSSDGEELKNLGDGLMVVFPTASAGLSCAVSMQQLVEMANRSVERSLGLRVGLSTGEVTREDNDYFGDPVVEAARLCALADAGQILATELLRGLSGRRTPHPVRRMGRLDLKGLPEPVEAVEVLWDALSDEQTVWSAAVRVDDEEFRATPSRPLIFGRGGAIGVVGLDRNDMGISATAGSIEWQWGLWWVVNHSRKRRLLLDDGTGGPPWRLDCGHRFAINTEHLTVLVPGEIFTHRIDVTIPDSDLPRVETANRGSGTLPADDLRLTERDKDALVALFSGYLEAHPRRSSHPVSYGDAARLLGPPWSATTVRKQIERVKERARSRWSLLRRCSRQPRPCGSSSGERSAGPARLGSHSDSRGFRSD